MIAVISEVTSGGRKVANRMRTPNTCAPIKPQIGPIAASGTAQDMNICIAVVGSGSILAHSSLGRIRNRWIRPIMPQPAGAGAVGGLGDGSVSGGFAGATADACTRFERLEAKLERHNGQLMRAAVELAKDWRTDKYLRNLEAMLIVADKEVTLVLTGNGDVLEPGSGVAAIGSGGNFALAAATAIFDYEEDAEVIARMAMAFAADICVYTNGNLTVVMVASALPSCSAKAGAIRMAGSRPSRNR